MFYLGVHRPSWLELADVPLFVTNSVLCDRRGLPRARRSWALDSGGFTELGRHGGWTTPPAAYAKSVSRYAKEVGQLTFASIQDWMTLPPLLERTGLTVADHQARTVRSLLELRDLDPDLPWAPALQGWTPDDYLRCADLYAVAGVDLEAEPIVGVGSIAARQDTEVARLILRNVHSLGVRIHGYGVKTGLRRGGQLLTSSDSMAWSYRARAIASDRRKLGKHGTTDGCPRTHCGNCLHFALSWRADLLTGAGRAADGIQGDLFAEIVDERRSLG